MDVSHKDNAICLVTVTYGRRWHLLRECLAAARQEGVTHAVVVDNGAQEDITTLATREFGEFVQVVRMGRNSGSAGGFKAGLAAARDSGLAFVFMLDDDNRPEPGTIESLRRAHVEASARGVPRDLLAMLAFRAGRQADVSAGVPASGMSAHASAFFGFRLMDLPFKLFRRTPMGRRWIAQRVAPPSVTVAIAPYSGLFFHRDVLARHGLPDERFVLYADDTEFSYRITQAGGEIHLVRDARLTDMEASWAVGRSFKSTFDALLLGDGDFRAFYSTRNNAYFEHWCASKGNWQRAINRALYLGVLRIRAAMLGRGERFRLLMAAIRDGEAQRLGVDPRFPL